MAIVGSNLTSGGAQNVASQATASITPTANNLVLISITSRHGSADPAQPTVTGCNLTWVQVNTISFDRTGSQKRITVLRALGASPSSQALTIDFGGQTQTNVSWTVDQFSGTDITGANGANAIVQSTTSWNNGTAGSSLTVTLAAFTNTANGTFGAFGLDTNTGHTVGGGFASVGYGQDAADSTSAESEFKTANDTSVDYSCTSALMGGIAIEIKAAPTIALTGTVTASITEADIVTGGKTIILTINNDTWVASGATFDNQRQNIINGIDSAQAEGTGWDAEVKAKEVVGAVVRTSNTVATVTLTAEAAYNITATETITATVPATALTEGVAVVASPTFTIAPVTAGTKLLAVLGIG